MTVNEKLKPIDNQFEQIKFRYRLDRQTVEILALSSRNIDKYEFLTGEDV